MQVRVLPARRGGAYLLRCRRGGYLVDGGAQDNLLPEMLADRKVKNLRAVICSSSNPERVGGILELLEAGYPVTEYWLPSRLEVLPELARRFNGDWDGWLDLLGWPHSWRDSGRNAWNRCDKIDLEDDSRRRLEGAAVLTALALTACLGWAPYKKIERSDFYAGCKEDDLSGLTQFFCGVLELLTGRAIVRRKGETGRTDFCLRRMGLRFFKGGSLEDLILACGRLLCVEAGLLPNGGQKSSRTIVQGLAMAAMTSAMMAKSSSRFRFFRRTGNLEDHFVPKHPIKCLNGKEDSPLSRLNSVSTPEMIFREARRLSGLTEGLVFQYGDAQCGVLFCGDTKMAFLNKGQVLKLDRPTVIVAPRQGNCFSESAYGRIVSMDPHTDIWVRSHVSYARKVSESFKEKPNKICLANCAHRTVQEILLSFNDGHWNCDSGGSCFCE